MISILIPIYNGIEFINESITSVLDQTYDEWELIIGINGHLPDSLVYKIAKIYEEVDIRIRAYDMQDIHSKSDALNAMLAYCSYDWIAILDVDDIWLPDKLKKQVPYMEYYDVIGTQCVYFENLECTIPEIQTGDISPFDFTTANPIINSSSLFKKGLANWQSKYDGIEDYDMWLRLREEGRKFYNLDEVLVKHRIHSNSAFNSKDNRELLNELLNERKFRNVSGGTLNIFQSVTEEYEP